MTTRKDVQQERAMRGVRVRYSQEQLLAAFDLVKNKRHWKGRINKTLKASEVNEHLITEAVVHFTGGIPEFQFAGDKVRVTAAGYWAIIGA